jgi:Leucine-rich repeat (LRR) protein/tRNA A-37 threonylcarbamoyl transferase component Bud32
MGDGHPSQAELHDFATGRLPDVATEAVAAHLEECDACRTLADQAPRDTLLLLLRQAHQQSLAGTENWSPQQPDEHATVSEHAGDTVVGSEVPSMLAAHPRYRIVGLAGHGGMGAVYKAEHVVMQRLVALKTVRAGLVANRTMLDRFQREVAAAARLSHPNVVAAYDAEHVGDMHFLVMEFVDGSTLADLVATAGAVSIAVACDHVQQAARGLQHAFERGMVHRDIKPHNLMVTPDGVVKVLDFGLARFEQEAALEVHDADAMHLDMGGSSDLTSAGAVMGTPDFMAPEQAGDAHRADIRADIFSLGCTLYFLLTGMKPFAGLATTKGSLATRRMRPLTDILPGVPRRLATVVEKMTAFGPDDRYQTPAEVVAALEPFTARYAASVRRRRRTAWSLAGALLLAAGCWGIVFGPRALSPFPLPSADRRVAKWTLGLGGAVTVAERETELPVVSDLESLPSSDFQLRRISVFGRTEPLGEGLAATQDLESLLEFDARESSFSDEDAARIMDARTLQILRLYKTRITDTGLKAIATMPALERLDVGANPITNAGLAALVANRNLRDLQISYTAIDDAGLGYLAAFPELESLYMSGTKVTDAGLSKLVHLRKLSRLHLANCKVTDAGLVHLEKLPRLSILYLSNTGITNAGLEHLESMQQLRFLDLQRSRVSSSGFHALRSALPRCNIKDLIGDENREQPLGAEEIERNGRAAAWIREIGGKLVLAGDDGDSLDARADVELPKVPFRIREIDLSGCQIEDNQLIHLTELGSLSRLILDRTTITGAGLVHLHGLGQLGELRLDSLEFGADGIRKLPALPRLAVLHATASSLNDDDLVNLERFPRLRALYAGGTRLTDAAVDRLPADALSVLAIGVAGFTDVGLARLPRMANLHFVHLGGTNISDAGLTHLQQMRSLSGLDLDGTKISDQGLKNLAPLITLRQLWLKGTRVTAEGVARFKSLVPACDVDVDIVLPASLPAEQAAIEREVATWCLSQKSKLRIQPVSSSAQELADGDGLPDGDFWVIGIDFSSNRSLCDADLERLAGLMRIERIVLSRTAISDIGLLHLRGFSMLKSIVLDGTKVTDVGLHHLTALKQLQFLGLYGTGVGDAGLQDLAAACKLKNVYAGRTRLTDRVAECLADSPVTVLSVSETPFSDEGLSRLPLLRDLQSIHLAKTRITNAGLKHLRRLPNLKVLDLADTQVSDEGIEELAHLAGLKTLNIKGTRITADTIARLRTLRPDIDIQSTEGGSKRTPSR